MDKSIKIVDEENGLQFIEIANSLVVARIALQGGHIDWWRPKLSHSIATEYSVQEY